MLANTPCRAPHQTNLYASMQIEINAPQDNLLEELEPCHATRIQ